MSLFVRSQKGKPVFSFKRAGSNLCSWVSLRRDICLPGRIWPFPWGQSGPGLMRQQASSTADISQRLAGESHPPVSPEFEPSILITTLMNDDINDA